MLKKMMFLSALMLVPFEVKAQSNADFYQDLLISEELKQQDAQQQADQLIQQKMQKAQSSAKDLLFKKSENLKLEIPDMGEISVGRKTENSEDNAPLMDVQDLDAAPFGLLWKANMETIKNLGVVLKPMQEEDYKNVFVAQQLPKGDKGFQKIQVTFGEENELWRIYAISDFIDDNPSASKGLRLYEMYARLLNKKYGNQQDFYTPAYKTVEKEVMERGKPVKITEQVPEKLENENFLKQLQSGEATLYSTFEGNGIGVALALNVDGNGQTYIVIDYKNLKIMQEREQEAYNLL